MATNQFRGRLTRLYVGEDEKTRIRIDIPPDEQPFDDFELLESHASYNSLYSLALASAINGYEGDHRQHDHRHCRRPQQPEAASQTCATPTGPWMR
jgi:hypothetical protein